MTEATRSLVVVEALIRGVTAEAAYAAVSDVERMGEWSPEGRGVRRSAGPLTVGDRFGGSNRNGWHRWSTSCVVVAATPALEFAFEVSSVGLPVARWSYEFEPAADGVMVRESWADSRGWLMRTLGTVVTGVRDRSAHNASTMSATLDALAESLSTPPSPFLP